MYLEKVLLSSKIVKNGMLMVMWLQGFLSEIPTSILFYLSKSISKSLFKIFNFIRIQEKS